MGNEEIMLLRYASRRYGIVLRHLRISYSKDREKSSAIQTTPFKNGEYANDQ